MLVFVAIIAYLVLPGIVRAMTGSAEAIGHLGARFAAEVPTTVNFAFGSAALDAAARRTR